MRGVWIIAAVAVLAACEDDSTDPITTTEWEATLSAREGYEGVTGSGEARTQNGTSTASVSIAGATAGAEHPWHVHSGTCATGGPIVGNAAAYPVLNIAAAGTASASATVTSVLSSTGSYFINVHASPDDLDTIVACGDLVRQ